MVEIRPATFSDWKDVRAVHLRAFPGSAEADLVERLEHDGDAAVSLVASDSGAIVGHILFNLTRVTADGRAVDALALAPVAVLPERQGRGIGSALIGEGLRTARTRGAQIVFVLGDPGYYGRFGFSAEAAAPFRSPYAGPHFQAKVLGDNFVLPRSGSADYARAFAELE
jgi:putative acetyltransferase